MAPPRTTRMLTPLAALALLGTLVSPAAAAPSEDEIARSRAAETSTSAQIASLEIELAEVSAQADEAGLRAQIANEDYLRAMEELAAAEARAQDAQAQAEQAAAELELARQALGEIATAAYRGGSGSLNSLQPFLSADGFAEAMSRSASVRQLGGQADEQVQRFEALQQVTTTLQRRAQESVSAQEAAANSLQEAAQEAQGSADAAATQLALSGERREQLITQLARQRSTTVELERERQDELDQQRREREAAASEAARRRAAETVDAAPSRSNDRRPTGGSAPEAPPAAAPSPAPTRTTVPTPTRTTAPTPARTAAPTPARTATPAPAPTRTTAPAPAPTRAPEPAPAPTRAPAPAPAPEPAAPPVTAAASAALGWARTQLGKPYGWGAAGPDAYDCSGLTLRAYQNAGKSLPRTSQAQYWATSRISADQLRPGDLVFYSRNGAPSGIYHVALYAGGNMRVHAPSPGRNVEEVPIWSSSSIIGYGRVS